jgi:hypothetical protein
MWQTAPDSALANLSAGTYTVTFQECLCVNGAIGGVIGPASAPVQITISSS